MKHNFTVKEHTVGYNVVDKPTRRIKQGDMVNINGNWMLVCRTGNHAGEGCRQCCFRLGECPIWITHGGYFRCILTYRYPTTDRLNMYFKSTDALMEDL